MLKETKNQPFTVQESLFPIDSLEQDIETLNLEKKTKASRILKEQASSDYQAKIPDKLYFKIGEVAKIVGVKPHVLRYWETEFEVLVPLKTQTKHRLYKRHEVEQILLVRDLLYKERFTIDGAKKRLKQSLRIEKKVSFADSHEVQASVTEQMGAGQSLLKSIRAELEQLLSLVANPQVR